MEGGKKEERNKKRKDGWKKREKDGEKRPVARCSWKVKEKKSRTKDLLFAVPVKKKNK